MGKKRFTSQQLYCLRNELPIDILIEKQLKMSCRMTDGRFRFLCPLCGQFDTAVNRQTNLARCFGCGKNFNTIDLVMLIRKAEYRVNKRIDLSQHKCINLSRRYRDPQSARQPLHD